ncbi:MAG: undecaprenyl/decaprenyl-phosphate alpha-N-acetylglucosaminyl 1-phosphate transferase [Candidatus Omnitrophica bacterium]|nr:undecaprenyl/decaprenyl-phosphate alpha-N-acetylglucosaminyl 1-phosphate transferase [Candidatus Omnitrophota bacterium]
MLIDLFFIVLGAFLLAASLVVALRRFSLKKNVLVRHGVSVLGGAAVGLAFIFACILGFLRESNFSWETAGIIVSSSIMLIFGLLDDWKELSVVNKFAVEFLATFCLIAFGVRTHIVYLADTGNIIITFIWVIGITNALNHLDVVDGVAGAITLSAAAAFFVISLLVANTQIQIMTLALLGAVLGFMLFNFPPAKIYMGSSGSHFLGFVLAAISLAIGYADLGREIALLSPLLILGFHIFDTTFLIVVRTSQGRSAFKKSDDHLALRFLKLGFSKRKTLLLMLGLSLVFSFAGVFISQAPNILGLSMLIFLFVISLVLAKHMGFTHV